MNMTYSTNSLRWQALVSRDPQADGAFLYGVRTTGIYCRPSCSSRRPKQENVVYFTSVPEAEAAGFRPCKRCMPDAVSPEEARRELVVRACQLIEQAEEPPSLDELASAVGLSPSHFHRLFKKVVGVTPREYAATLRARRFENSLAAESSITDAMYEAGFSSSSRLYEASNGMLGMTPSRYQLGAAGLTIRYAIADSFLGHVLVAATPRGLCAIEFGESPEVLATRLEERFPNAQLVEDYAGFADWVSQVTALIETPSQGLDLPLDIQGTAFQRRVWKALQGIPAGSTRSYGEIAQAIGQPTAAQAVASACASNRIAVAIPCHRVVRSNGELGGYRWGLERKRALLEREAAG